MAVHQKALVEALKKLGFGKGITPWWVSVPYGAYSAYDYLAPIAKRGGQEDRAALERWVESQKFKYFPASEIDPGSPWMMPTPPGVEPVKAAKAKPRKVSTANKAMKGIYKFLIKKQKGKLTQKKCRLLLSRCSKIAGKANPHTKSRIGKGSSANQKLARKMRKKYWGTTKHA